MTSHHHHLAQQMTGDPNVTNTQAPTPPLDRLPGDIRNLLDLVDTALEKAAAAGVLHGAGLRHSLGDSLRELAEGITGALDTARRARRDHLDHEARFAGYVDQANKDYSALEHAYERLSDRLLADGDSVRHLLDTLNAIRRLEGRAHEDVAREAIALAHGALVAWHDRAGVADRYDRHLPAGDAAELAALEELEVLEPLRRGDLAEVVADGTLNLSPRYLRRADRPNPQAEELPLPATDEPATADRLVCQRPECGRPISEHRAHHGPPEADELDGAVEGRFAVDTHGLYCPTPPA